MAKKLTYREIEILTLVENCNTNQEIAGLLAIKVATVVTHLNNIYRKLGVSNRMQAVYILHTQNRP